MNKFRFLTSGESHGMCLNAIIEGMPANVAIDCEFINEELAKRQQGYGRGARMQIETDKVQIKSGVRFGITTGAPICLEIQNKDWQNWSVPMSVVNIDMSNPEISDEIISKKITRRYSLPIGIRIGIIWRKMEIQNYLRTCGDEYAAIQRNQERNMQHNGCSFSGYIKRADCR